MRNQRPIDIGIRTLVCLAAAWYGLSSADAGNAADKIVFDRDIRPILSDNCFACHGPDAAQVKAKLRIDLRDSVTKSRDGHAAIVPGKPEKSELVKRIFADDEFTVMPPPETNKKLTEKQKQLLKQWIVQGAEYTGHWSFETPKQPPLPKVKNTAWVRNEIDRFILARLEAKGLNPSKRASRETLIRRVSLDLRGLPPTLQEIESFLKDKSPTAYESMVDRMLASPHFGEKMARIWMDLARYGDTNGYHYDSTRQAWLWRDWVINAYNSNMPFDRFTIEQLAGDLLPNATVQQKVASGFNRNTRYNEEGGADPEEWRVEYAKDRVRTLGQVWLGLTTGCAECHSHKYDPITQKEFYQLYAFFNSLDEPGAQGHRQKYPPFIKVPTPQYNAKITALKSELETIQEQIRSQLVKIQYREPKTLPPAPKNHVADVVWIDDAPPAGAKLAGNSPWQWVEKGKAPVHSGNRATRRSGTGLTQHYFTNAKNPLVVSKNSKLFAWVWLDPKNPPKAVQLQFNDGNWEHRAIWGRGNAHGRGKGPQNFRAGKLPAKGKWVRLEVDAKSVGLKPGAKINGWAFTQVGGTVYYDTAGMSQKNVDTRHLKSLALWEKRAIHENSIPAEVRAAVKIPSTKRSAQQQKLIRDYYVEHVWQDSRKIFDPLHKQVASVQMKIKKAENDMPFQLVSVELPKPKPAYLLIRGDFRKKGEQVQRKTPAAFPAFPKGKPKNRLGLAHWLVQPNHPLTSRVTVNRYWAQLFGRGIVETIGDFGHLGRYPTHPQLLDWLAVEFVNSGWDRKHILKLMVMSATYQQTSVNDHRHDKIDPANHLLWRAPRFRLPAEEIRDSSLQIAGMLSTKIGGPPVFPYQPKDYYKGKKGGWSWNLSQGEDRYRRGMYTFWRRTTPYPTFIIFDAPDRSSCTVARPRTNTPLQALATMNDPQFVEASRVLGQRVLTEGPKNLDGRLSFAFRLATARNPNQEELTVLQETYREQLAHYQKNPEAAKKLIQAGTFQRPENLDPIQHATWTAIANALLNLDETITRE
ncbi:MAG: PSD1 and planctomycete cytochrome C domain-containing protein [Planctomycetaceae bacterium]